MSAQDFIQDTDEFFDDFAEQATLDGVPIWGVPDEEFVDVNGHEEKRPTFIVPTKGVDIPHKGTLINSMGTFIVREVQDDGTGIALLMLEKQNA